MRNRMMAVAAAGLAFALSAGAAFAQDTSQRQGLKYRNDGFQNGYVTQPSGAPNGVDSEQQTPNANNSNYPGFGPNTGSVTGSGVQSGPQYYYGGSGRDGSAGSDR